MMGTTRSADRLGGLIARLLGVFLVLGGLGELIGAVGHSRVNEVLAVLHADGVVRAWVGLQAVMSIGVGLELLRSAKGLTHREAISIRRGRGCVVTFLGLIAVSQLLLAWRLYPRLLEAPPPEPFPGFWVLSMAFAPLGPALMAAVLLFRLRRQERT